MPTERSFPIAFRLATALAAVVVLALILPVVAHAADPVTEQDVEDARSKKRQLLDELESMQLELHSVQDRLAMASVEVEAAEELLEETRVELLATQQRLERTNRRYEQITSQLNARISDAYMEGPGSNLNLVLGAESLTDLSDTIQFVDAVAQSDANLAQEAANLRNLLEADEARLLDLEKERQRLVDETKERRDQLAADLARQEELTAAIDAKADEASEYVEDIATDLRQQERELAQQQYSNVALPKEWQGLLEVCPVAQPRAFGDGFGAPRYVGGYHPHRGVDIVAPEGTEVYAPFDGVARDATNYYGGTSVEVVGAHGYVYNAHLGSIAKLGPVQAGEVIGYVSSTGIAGGSTPHDHFEFIPNVMPSNWQVSAYGYSQIDGRLNPYPLLVDACY